MGTSSEMRRVAREDFDIHVVGTSSAVLSRTFVARSLGRNEARDDGLNAARGAVNAALISLIFWIVLGFAVFGIF